MPDPQKPRHARVLVGVLHLPRTICDLVVGRHHTMTHRMVAGGAVAFCGVCIAHSAELVPVYGAPYVLDLLGYAVHAVGLVPFIDQLAEAINKE